jgi:hypothetical protein
MAPDLLATIRDELEQRLAELRPLLSEYERLVATADALDIADADAAPGGHEETVSATVQVPPRRRGRPRRVGTSDVDTGTSTPGAPAPSTQERPSPRKRAPQEDIQQAILAALEHGSHTAGELVMVTAMSPPNVRSNLSHLTGLGAIKKTKRDGKTAYVLGSQGRG